MLVFDTTAFINGWNDHLPPVTFPSVWSAIGVALADARIILVREVYREVLAQDDELKKWLNDWESVVVEPDEAVQRAAGEVAAMFPPEAGRHAADPFVLAEARARGFTVVTYEGRNFSGERTRRWATKMPGVCQHFSIPCVTLPESLRMLGVSI